MNPTLLTPIVSEILNKFNVYEINFDKSTNIKQMSAKDMIILLNNDNVNIIKSDTYDIINNYDKINLRDIRRLDYNFNPNGEAVISIRKHAVIFSIDTTRAIITSKKLLFIVPDGADSMLGIIIKHMKLFDSINCKFEYHAYDGLLSVTKHFDVIAINDIKKQSVDIINKLKKHAVIPMNVQEKLKLLKNSITELSKHFDKIKQLLDDIMDDDEKLTFLNLTLLNENPELFKNINNDSQIMEIREKMSSLFEVYLFDYSNLSMQISEISDNIKHSEESAMLRLSSIRNQLMIVNTIIGIITCVIGFCSYVAGIFGMNLDNTQYIQPIKGVFNYVIIATMIFMPTVTILTIMILKKYNYIPS